MTLRPCLTCGEPSDGPRCPEHTLDTRKPKPKDHVHANRQLWKTLSQKVRRMQPWCLDCGSREDLTADHIIPFSVCPELAHTIENLTTRCRYCNGKRGNNFTAAEAHGVLTALQTAYNRRPTKQGRERLNAAQQAILTTRGDAPTPAAPHPSPRQSLRLTPQGAE